MVNNATFVFPAPVGAHTSKFSLVLYAASKTTDCILLRLVIPWNAFCPTLNTKKKNLFILYIVYK